MSEEPINLLVTAGTGPAECRIAVGKLLLEMEKEAGRAELSFHSAAGTDPDGHGPASAVVTVAGAGTREFAASFEGTVRFTFRSPVRKGHKRQNWFVGVTGIGSADGDGPGAAGIPAGDVRFETTRAGGPGGQHQNTTDSAVRAIHLPTGLVAFSREERSQHRNKAIALGRLENLLAMLAADAASARKREVSMLHKVLERGNETRHFREA